MIQRQTGKRKPTIWCWQPRFMAESRWSAARRNTARPFAQHEIAN
jgi:hypothetical protein